ncbi:MAG: T9SS type A sorting domain-containing protein [Ignavibacteria bacterium]|nr:T9SS type A sorting domain-containing protein [Ignavibacteria bacterium]
MKTCKIFLFAIMLFATGAYASPKISFHDLLAKSEIDPHSVIISREAAIKTGLPVNIITSGRVMFDVKGIENNKVVYAVFTDLADVYNGGYTAFYDEIVSSFNPAQSRIDYGNGRIVDNTGGMFDPVISSARGGEKFLMIPDWTFDRVSLFSSVNGDLLDTAFISHSNPQLQSPKHAQQLFDGRSIVVSDQISDLVQKFDTAGSYVGFFAPVGGVNTAILDNIRGIRFRPNRNLLVTVGSGTSQNTIQQFDEDGNHTGTFITENLSSPFDILLRQGDMLITNSGGTNKITKFTLDGTFISAFYSGSDIAFPQQMYQLANGNVVVAGFSTPSGLIMFDSTGNYIRSLTGVTGCRSAYLLGNGNYLTTNGTGVHEVDSTTGALVRTVVAGANFQYISEYIPDLFVSAGNSSELVSDFRLHQNYPNPFNPVTAINFDLPKSGNVTLKIYDQLGSEVAVLVNEFKVAGSYSVNFNAEDLATGVYFYRLNFNGISEAKKMLLVK